MMLRTARHLDLLQLICYALIRCPSRLESKAAAKGLPKACGVIEVSIYAGRRWRISC